MLGRVANTAQVRQRAPHARAWKSADVPVEPPPTTVTIGVGKVAMLISGI
jgi:hypothetical protein